MIRYLVKIPGRVGGSCRASFRCGETVLCDPPYVKGKIDSCWIHDARLDTSDKVACEKVVGMKLEPYDEDHH